MTVSEIWDRYAFNGRAVIIKPKDWSAWSMSGEPQPVVFPELHRRSAVWIVQHQKRFFLCRDTEGLVGGYPVVGPLDAAEEISANSVLAWIRQVGNREV
jgi:hypothetical protein